MAKAREVVKTAQDELEQTAGADTTENAQGKQTAPEMERSTDSKETEKPLGFEDGTDEDANPQAPADLPPGAPLEYAVTGCDFLRLREWPGLDAPVIAKLPKGVGVFDTGEIKDGWWKVYTGRLAGWVLSEYLEPVWD